MQTTADLRRIGLLYDENFEKIHLAFKQGNKEDQKKYIKEEHRLNQEDINCRRALGIYINDPCPRVKVSCGICEARHGGCELLKRNSSRQHVGQRRKR